jgi:glycyl-tRNA synthetase alpha chain
VYNFEMADVEKAWRHFELCESECQALIARYWEVKKGSVAGESAGLDRKRIPLLAAYDLCLKCSHLFNILDARGAISVTERVGVIARVRGLAVGIARAYVDQQGESPPKIEKEPAAENKRKVTLQAEAAIVVS